MDTEKKVLMGMTLDDLKVVAAELGKQDRQYNHDGE